MSDFIHENGWNREAEDFSFIRDVTRSKVPQAFKSFARPAEVRPDLSGAHRIENQSSMGSCQGFTIASCCEALWWIGTNGDTQQLSSIFAYLATQKLDGLLGSDRGSTISNGVRLATENGICPEELAPYPNPVRYPGANDRNRILSQANYQAGEPYKIRSSVGIKSHEDALNWIGGGGVISIGISWPPGIRTVGQWKVVESFSGGGGGGHAVAILGYMKDGSLIVGNSHNYYFLIRPAAFEQMLRHRYTACIGLSDLVTPKPRHFSWKTGKLSTLIKTIEERRS